MYMIDFSTCQSFYIDIDMKEKLWKSKTVQRKTELKNYKLLSLKLSQSETSLIRVYCQ